LQRICPHPFISFKPTWWKPLATAAGNTLATLPIEMKDPRLALKHPVAACLLAAVSISSVGAYAQTPPDTLIVLDASGSMWGQIEGRSKIEIARETLSSVLSEASSGMNIGMIAYGHRVRGQCSDIETLVPLGPANQTVPEMIDAASRINPRGMTPLTDSVRKAARDMLWTERAATVVLVTDGIETCDADPCALGEELEAAGIDFTAHVVGFGLTGDEGRQVACLAENTGGSYFPADDADQLADALRQTIVTADESDFIDEEEFVEEPASSARAVEIILRDTEGGEPLTARQLSILVEPLDEKVGSPEGFEVHYEGRGYTASGSFEPGSYQALVRRSTDGGNSLAFRLAFDIPDGEGTHRVDLVIAARLKLNAFANSGLPMPAGYGNLPFAHYGSDSGRAHFEIYPIIDGAIDISTELGGINSREVAIAPGDYLIRGGLAQSFSRERLVHVPAGVTTEYDFDFEAARIFVDVRDAQGFPVERQNAYFYSGMEQDHFTWGGSGPSRSGDILPFYLPEGTWRVNAGRSGGGATRAEAVVTVSRAGEDLRLDLRENDRIDDAAMALLMAEDNRGCHPVSGYRCTVEIVDAADVLRHLGIDPTSAEGREALKPRYTGTWQTTSGMMALVQEGRRVWGDVAGGTLWGEVASDGMTLRGVIASSASSWGVFEFRLDDDGSGFAGGWARGVKPALGNGTYTARRLSAGVPSLARAIGSDADLPVALRGGIDPDFEAFMAPARGPASGDLDEMQASALKPGFAGVWTTSSQAVTFHQSGRRVWGERKNGVLEGEISRDGRTLRGTWTDASGSWGLMEFVMDEHGAAFTGRWGRRLDTELSGGNWTGQRATFLAPALEKASGTDSGHPADVRSGVSSEFEAFMVPVRDPAPAEPEADERANASPVDGQLVPLSGDAATGSDDTVPVDGFVPVRRYDFASMTTMQPTAAVAFTDYADGVQRGKVLLRQGWCGADCAAETLDIEFPSNAEENLYKGGRFYASSKSGPLVFVSEVMSSAVIKLDIAAATGDFSNGDEATGETYSTLIGREVDQASVEGFDLSSVAAEPEAEMPQRGSETAIPPGIYGFVERAGFDPSASDDIAEAANACARRPLVFYPDGHVEAKRFSAATASSGQPYQSMVAGHCTPTGDPVNCALVQADGAQTVELNLKLTPLADGHLRVVNHAQNDAEGFLYACVRPGGEMSATETLPDGRKVIDHLMQRSDGGPELSYADDGQYLGPLLREAKAPSAAPEAVGNFSAIAGLYGRMPSSGATLPLEGDELIDACYYNGMVLYKDGFAQGFSAGEWPADQQMIPPPKPQMYMTCEGSPAAANCVAMHGVWPNGTPVPDRVDMKTIAADTLEICLSGTCFRMQQCREPRAATVNDPPAPDGRHWLDHVLLRPDGGPELE